MEWVKGEIEGAFQGIFVYSIQIGMTEQGDRMASFYDNLNRQALNGLQQHGTYYLLH